MYNVTIKDEFFGIELSGNFKTIKEAKEYYAQELDCNPEDVDIIKVVKIN